ncbi:Acyl-coenzyme A dehydrogenase [compost metagenome]
MDVHGGKGIIMGPNNYLGRNWQGAPIFITVEGANILSRNLMIFGQGAIRCHPFVLQEMALAGREDHDQALGEFDDLLLKHMLFAVGNAASTLVLGLGLGALEKAPGDRLSQGYFRALNRQAAAFALLADLSMMLLGGALKRRERLSARLGDVLSYLYLSSAALKRYHDLGSPEYMQPLLRWAMEESLGQAESALDRLLDNFPNRFVGCALRVLVFPFGRRHTGPSDELDAEVAELLGRRKGDPALEQLLAGCFRPEADGDAVAALQRACDALDDTAPLHKRLAQALKEGVVQPAPGQCPIDAAVQAGVLQQQEGQQLQAAEQARRAVIAVDAFDKQYLQPIPGQVR